MSDAHFEKNLPTDWGKPPAPNKVEHTLCCPVAAFRRRNG